jgi:diadenosine tetraphosphate (Ap4A) HIT family hydrolase
VENCRTGSIDECLFCRSEDPYAHSVLARTANFYARYDNFPVSPGHVEIVPIRHVESFFDLSADEVAEAYDLMRTVRDKLVRLFHPDGFNIGVNDGAAAGRTIHHLHIHIISRYTGDVEDPRGGVRNIVPSPNTPDMWSRGNAR